MNEAIIKENVLKGIEQKHANKVINNAFSVSSSSLLSNPYDIDILVSASLCSR